MIFHRLDLSPSKPGCCLVSTRMTATPFLIGNLNLNHGKHAAVAGWVDPMVPDESGKFPKFFDVNALGLWMFFWGGWSNLDLGRTHFDDPKLEVMF